jgi:dipeptidyl aminopeptidase/acylaminoacyl peptidase
MVKKTTSSITRLNLAKNEVLDYQYIRALSYQAYGGASTGEVLRVADEIKRCGATRESWVTTWIEQGRYLCNLAEESLALERKATARAQYLRAFNYLRAAEFYFWRNQPAEHRALYDESTSCFDRASQLFDHPCEKIAVPYENGVAMPGYLLKPDASGFARPTIIICGGGDSFGEETYFNAGVPEALARGLNVVLFHGPGQRGLLHRHPDQVFRHDYEVPIGAIIDYLEKRSDVDVSQIALYGYSLGGYFAPRAAAFEPRIRAVIPNAPMMSFHDFIVGGIVGVLPGYLAPFGQWLADHASAGIWNQVGNRLKRDWVYEATLELYMLWTNGVTTFAEYVEATRAYTLEGLVERIQCPVLCLSAEGEGPEPIKQARQFYECLKSPKTYYSLTLRDGADSHVGMNNITHTAGVVYDWVTQVFSH